MQKEYIERLIAKIGGLMRPGENTKRYLERVAADSGVHFDSAHAAYYGRYVSKTSFEKFKQAARNATHTKSALVFANYHLGIWETDPEFHREEIDATREFIERIRRSDDRRRRYNENRQELDIRARGENGGEEE